MNSTGRAWFVEGYVRVLVRSWSDAEFAGRLELDPRTAMAECGLDTPAGTPVRLVRADLPNWDVQRAMWIWFDSHEIELPYPADHARLISDDDLGDLAGGQVTIAADLAAAVMR